MENESLAGRLANYSDALVGVTVVGISGLSIQLMEPSSRCSIADALVPVILGSAAFAATVILLLITLRRWENDLLADVQIQAKARTYSHRLYLARLAIVIICTIVTIVFVMSAAGDPQCVTHDTSAAVAVSSWRSMLF